MLLMRSIDREVIIFAARTHIHTQISRANIRKKGAAGWVEWWWWWCCWGVDFLVKYQCGSREFLCVSTFHLQIMQVDSIVRFEWKYLWMWILYVFVLIIKICIITKRLCSVEVIRCSILHDDVHTYIFRLSS